MIEVITKNTSLDLSNDAKIIVKKKSTLFSILDNKDKQNYSYPFFLPNSSKNNFIISNILNEKKEETLQAIVRKNGLRLFKADLVVTERTNKNYEVVLQLNQKVDLFNKKMNTLFEELGTFFITDNNHYVDLQLVSVLSPSMWSNQNGSITVIVSGFSYTVSSTIDTLLSNLAISINNDRTNNNAIATVTSTNKIKIERDNSTRPFYSYADNSKTTNSFAPNSLGIAPYPKNNTTNQNEAITHANTVDALADFRDVAYCFPYFISSGSYINYHNQTQYLEYGTSGGLGTFSVVLPSFRLTAIIEKILSIEGWKLESNFLKDENIEKIFLANCYYLKKLVNGHEQLQNPIQFLQFFIADCLPNISLSEIIEELQNLFCLTVDYEHTRKVLKINTAEDIISQKFSEIYECTENYSEKTKKQNTGYTFRYETPNYSELKNINTSLLATRIFGDGSTEIISNFPFFYTLSYDYEVATEGLPSTADFYTPSSFVEFSYNTAYPLFLMNQATNFVLKEGYLKSFNFMSYQNDRRALHESGIYSLEWRNLYQQFYSRYLSLLDNSEVEREIIVTVSELQSLDILKLVRLLYSNYYIKEIEYPLTNNEQIRILAKVKLIKTI